jgi:uncharacterized repeat protein (TIGR03803 family)
MAARPSLRTPACHFRQKGSFMKSTATVLPSALHAIAVSWVLAAIALPCGITSPALAQTETVLHSFAGTDGQSPQADLFRVGTGTLLGTTTNGGNLSCPLGNSYGCGTVFKFITADDELVVLHEFQGPDGLNPNAGVFRSTHGTIYGTTFRGGNCLECGVIYEVGQSGRGFNVLHYFAGTPTDGANPQADLLRDAQGNFFGTTLNGGAYGQGAVFELDTSNHETLLYSFQGGSDGANPQSALVEDGNGNFYGSTASGGASNCGTLYELSPKGGTWQETVLYAFTCKTDGGGPLGNMVLHNRGLYTELYGATQSSGDPTCNCGTVFVYTPDVARFRTLYAFKGGNDGAAPGSGVILSSTLKLYGTTLYGGSTTGLTYGTVYQDTLQGTETVLYRFTGGADGGTPVGGVVRDHSSGKLYGTTYLGGANNLGVVFEVAP